MKGPSMLTLYYGSHAFRLAQDFTETDFAKAIKEAEQLAMSFNTKYPIVTLPLHKGSITCVLGSAPIAVSNFTKEPDPPKLA